jgi:hypothetical protein
MKAQYDSDEPTVYEIRIGGHLDAQWTCYFSGLRVVQEADSTLLTGSVADQAALFLILRKIRDTGMRLLSVNAVEPAIPTGASGNLLKTDR